MHIIPQTQVVHDTLDIHQLHKMDHNRLAASRMMAPSDGNRGIRHTSKAGLDLGKDQLVPERGHAAAGRIPRQDGCFLGCVARVEERSADRVAGLDGAQDTVVDAVVQTGNGCEQMGLHLLDVLQ